MYRQRPLYNDPYVNHGHLPQTSFNNQTVGPPNYNYYQSMKPSSQLGNELDFHYR